MLDTNGDGVVESATLKANFPSLYKLAMNDPRPANAALLDALDAVGAAPIGALRYWLPDDVIILACTTPTFNKGFAFEHLTLPTDLIARLPAGIKLGTTPGTFLCGQLFVAAQLAALEPHSSILMTPHGDSAVGFLHIPRLPRSEARFRPQWVPPQADTDPLMLALRDSVARTLGAALRGFHAQLQSQCAPAAPLRVLLTGFGPFGGESDGIVENPSALLLGNVKLDFLSHVLVHAFPAAQVCRGEARDLTFDVSEAFTLQSFTRDFLANTDSGASPAFTVRSVVFPTDASAVTLSHPRSVQAEISRFAPHVIIGLGVSGQPGYRFGPYGSCMTADFTCTIEPYATAKRSATPEIPAPTDCVLRANYALARAVSAGNTGTR